MNNLLWLLDAGSFFAIIIFVGLALYIHRKIMLPQNKILLLVGVFMFIHVSSHIPSYFPETFPQIDEFTEHFISDLSLFLSSIILLFYGFTTAQAIKKSSFKKN